MNKELISVGKAKIEINDLQEWNELLKTYRDADDNSPIESILTHFYRQGHNVYWNNGQVFKHIRKDNNY